MINKTLILFAGIVLGYLVTKIPFTGMILSRATGGSAKTEQPVLKYPLKVTLYRFKLNKDKMDVYREWIQWHHDEYKPMIKTLEREKMYFESVFRDSVSQPDIIYWLTINGAGGESSATSQSAIDIKHNAYMKQILVKGSRSILTTEFTLIPDFIGERIGEHQLTGK